MCYLKKLLQVTFDKINMLSKKREKKACRKEKSQPPSLDVRP